MAAFSTVAVRFLLVALLAGGIGGAIFVVVRNDDDDGNAQVAGQMTQTATPASTATLAPSTPTTTLAPTTAATEVPTSPPLPTPTPDTRVPSAELPTLDQIQLGKDGKYFIADRGDGCSWLEALREQTVPFGEIVVLRTECPAGFQFTFRPATGDIAVTIS